MARTVTSPKAIEKYDDIYKQTFFWGPVPVLGAESVWGAAVATDLAGTDDDNVDTAATEATATVADAEDALQSSVTVSFSHTFSVTKRLHWT